MRSVGVAAAVLASGCFFISPVMRFGGGKSAKEVEHDTVRQLTPPALVVDAPWRGPVSTAKIRVWADDDYRAQNGRWQQSFQDQLDHANELLAAQFGVRLVAEYRAWDRHAPGATLADSLAVLVRDDPGDDVLTVVGLTSSLTLVSATFEQLGYAEVPGHHLVLRGYADAEERQAFERAFGDLRADEREELYQARRRHRTAALILHELGHNLGAPHDPDPDTIMSATYSDKARSFDPDSRATILATLDQRLHRAPTASPGDGAARADAHTTLVIAIDAHGQRLVGGNALDDRTLDDLLRLTADDDRDALIVVRFSPAAPMRAVTQVMEHAYAAGLRRVSRVQGD